MQAGWIQENRVTCTTVTLTFTVVFQLPGGSGRDCVFQLGASGPVFSYVMFQFSYVFEFRALCYHMRIERHLSRCAQRNPDLLALCASVATDLQTSCDLQISSKTESFMEQVSIAGQLQPILTSPSTMQSVRCSVVKCTATEF